MASLFKTQHFLRCLQSGVSDSNPSTRMDIYWLFYVLYFYYLRLPSDLKQHGGTRAHRKMKNVIVERFLLHDFEVLMRRNDLFSRLTML